MRVDVSALKQGDRVKLRVLDYMGQWTMTGVIFQVSHDGFRVIETDGSDYGVAKNTILYAEREEAI